MKRAKEDVQEKVRRAIPRRKQTEISQEEEEILRKAQIYLLFTAKRPMFWNVAAIREVKGKADTRYWIIAVHFHAPSGHEGYLGDLCYDGEQFTELTDVELMRERVRQIVEDAGSSSSIQ